MLHRRPVKHPRSPSLPRSSQASRKRKSVNAGAEQSRSSPKTPGPSRTLSSRPPRPTPSPHSHSRPRKLLSPKQSSASLATPSITSVFAYLEVAADPVPSTARGKRGGTLTKGTPSHVGPFTCTSVWSWEKFVEAIAKECDVSVDRLVTDSFLWRYEGAAASRVLPVSSPEGLEGMFNNIREKVQRARSGGGVPAIVIHLDKPRPPQNAAPRSVVRTFPFPKQGLCSD